MAAPTGLSNIEKLTEENYELWKVHMKSVLIFNDLWSYVDGTEVKTDANVADWTKKDSKALALINLSITHGQLNHVKRATTSKQAWDGVKAVFESRGPVRKAALYKRLLRMEKRTDITITQYVTDFTHTAEQLSEAGIVIPDELLSIMLLSSLPSEFENFCVAIESRDTIPSLNDLKIKLIEEEARQNDRDAKVNDEVRKGEALFTKGRFDRSRQSIASSSDSMKTSDYKFSGKCYNCGKIGHVSRVCKSKSKNDVSNIVCDAMTAIACNTEISEKAKSWYLDSGATRHMSNNRENFVNLDKTEKLKVYTAADNFINSEGSGIVHLQMKSTKNAANSVKLKNALYVPGLRNNLISVSKVTNNDYTVTFAKTHATVNREDGSVALTATKHDDLYVVNEGPNYAMFSYDKVDENLIKWHQRYGHLNINDLQKMKNTEMVSGITFASKTNEIGCEICAKCKIHALPFKRSETRETQVLGLIHSDICGPMNTESLGGAKYFVTFIDDYSRYTETTMLRNRSDALQAFKNFKKKVENETGQRIKKLRTDNGKEYLSNNFNKLLEEDGVSRQFTVEYTPQQNGVAERANRTLVEMARCIMLEADLPESLWAEAVNTATFLRNRSATACLDGITPYEAWTGRKPYVGFLRTIGSKTIALNKGQRRGKFKPKGDSYVLVGYSHEAKAYRLWEQGTKTVIKSRDVKFFENIRTQPIPAKETITMPHPLMNTTYDEQQGPNEEDDGASQPSSTNKSSEEDPQAEEQAENQSRRGPGRPKLAKTGKPGRPAKIYSLKKQLSLDPESASQISERDDKDL